MNVLIRCTVLTGLAAVSGAYAQTEEPIEVHEPIVVTASRWAETVDQSLAAVTVIDRSDIIVSQAQDLMELLRLQSGVDVSRTGGPGSQVSVFLRGTNSNHVLVMVDGIRVASAHTGAFTWEHLPLEQVERIEIVRGPQASYYGSDAIGGIIHIITRRNASSSAHLELGQNDAFRGAAGLSAGNADQRYWATVAYRDVGGFSAQNEDGFSFHPDDDGYRSRSLTAGMASRIGEQRLQVQLSGVDAEVEFDQGVSDTQRYELSASLSGELAGGWRHRLRGGVLDDDLNTPDFFSRFEVERAEIDWQLDYPALERHQLTAGVNLVEEEGTSLDTFSGSAVYDRSRHNYGVFAGWRYARRGHDLQIGLRRDDNSEFGSETTGQVAWGHDYGDHWRTVVSYGTAFRAPSLSQQFSPGFGGLFAGNPDLAPETSRSAEVALRYRPSAAHAVDLSLYRTEIQDLIDFSGVDFQAINVAEARILGAELQYRYDRRPWQVTTNLTLQDAEDVDTGAALLRRPDEKLALIVERALGSALIGGELLYSGERRDFAADLDGYTLVNLRLRRPLSSTWTGELRVENLLDEDYRLAHGFNTPGRTAYIGVRYQPR